MDYYTTPKFDTTSKVIYVYYERILGDTYIRDSENGVRGWLHSFRRGQAGCHGCSLPPIASLKWSNGCPPSARDVRSVRARMVRFPVMQG